MQTIQRVVFGVLPFGSVGTLSLLDVSIGLQIAGSYTLYFGELVSPYSLARIQPWNTHAARC